MIDLTPGFNLHRNIGGGIPFISRGNGSSGNSLGTGSDAGDAATLGQVGVHLAVPAGAPAPSTPTSNPTNKVTGAPTAVAHPALNRAAVDNTQLAIDQIPALLQAALAAEATNHTNAINGFNDQEAAQRKQYDASTTTNQNNYDSNFMDAIRAGIHGLGGLYAILRGSGAAGGTAEDLVRDTVGGTTANDIRTGADTQSQNQTQLDSSLSNFLTDLKGKRQAAEDTFTNNNRAIQRDSNTNLQDLYSKMAGYYGDAGDTGQADAFMAKAGALTPSIASNSRTAVSAYDTTPVAVTAPQLTAFSGPTQPSVATAPQDGQVGSGIFTISKRKDQNTTPAAATPLPVGA